MKWKEKITETDAKDDDDEDSDEEAYDGWCWNLNTYTNTHSLSHKKTKATALFEYAHFANNKNVASKIDGRERKKNVLEKAL